MTYRHPYPHIDLQEVVSRTNSAAVLLAALTRDPLPLLPVWEHVIAALNDTERLVDEITGLRAELVAERHQRANLIAAVRATLAADREGDDDPLWYIRDELPAQTRGTGHPAGGDAG